MKRAATLLFALCATSIAYANSGPPPGKKFVPVITVIETTEAFPDYVFLESSWSRAPGRRDTLHFFAPNSSIKSSGVRDSGGELYAIPRTFAEGVPGFKDLAADAAKQNPPKHVSVPTSDEEWTKLAQLVNSDMMPGSARIEFGTRAELRETDARETLTANYRMVRTPEGIAFTRTNETDESDEGDPALAPQSPFPWKWIAAAIFVTVAVVIGGVWVIRRLRSTRLATTK